MVRLLEANGYDVSYTTGVDADRRGASLLTHKVYLSVGHDEYWSGAQRANVEAARAAGVHLAFFSGNEVFWKTRWENSIDGSGTPYRTLVCYKETHANAMIDPQDPPTGPGRGAIPGSARRQTAGGPQNALTGQMFGVNDGDTTAITVPAAFGKHRFWRNTSVATLAAGATATLAANTLGYEWDIDVDNGFAPSRLMRLSQTTRTVGGQLLDYGSTFGRGTVTHTMTPLQGQQWRTGVWRRTVQWAWGLDSNHDRGSAAADVRMQQATVNLFADMGASRQHCNQVWSGLRRQPTRSRPLRRSRRPRMGPPPAPEPRSRSAARRRSGRRHRGRRGGFHRRRFHLEACHRHASWTFNWTAAGSGSVNYQEPGLR